MRLLNQLSKFFIRHPAKLCLALVLVSLSASPALCKPVVVDIASIYNNYDLVLEANSKLDAAEAKFKRIVSTAEREMQSLRESGKAKELQTKQAEIQEIIDTEMADLQDLKIEYNKKINLNIATALEKLSKTKNYELILDKAFIVSELYDATNELITELKKL